MSVDFYNTYASFIGAISLGIIFGLIYDIFRILRISRMPYLFPKGKLYDIIKIPTKQRSAKTNRLRNILSLSANTMIMIEDIIFCMIISLAEILFIYHINGGEIRIYYFVFTFIGASIYFFTAGKTVMYFAVRIIFLIRCFFYWSFYIMIYPIRKTFLIFKKSINLIIQNIITPISNKRNLKKLRRYSDGRKSAIFNQIKNGCYISEYKNDKKAKEYTF